jgi:hypothetical protein
MSLNPERSTNLFRLAEECNVPFSIDEIESFTNESLSSFIEKYRSWAAERDKCLSDYLKKRSSSFRVYLPYSPQVFNLSYRTLWYFDEIIIRDPILYTLLPAKHQIPLDIKKRLIHILSLLSHFKDTIESGYILFAGDSILIREDVIKKEDIELLLQNESVRSALEKSVKFGHTVRKDNFGNDWNIYQISIEMCGIFQMEPSKNIKFEPGQTVTSPYIKVGETLPPISKEQLAKIARTPVIEDAKKLFPIEVTDILLHVERASHFGSAVMFDYNLPHDILSEVQQPILQSFKQEASVLGLNLTLPYLEGIPPDKLLELREEMPESFRVFRLKMNEIIGQALNSTNKNPNDELKMIIDQKLLPQIHTLDADMKAAGRKIKILGLGAPAIACSATLIGAALLFPPAGLGVVLGGGTLAGLKAISDGEAKRIQLASNPFYFIWKARQS